MPVILLRVTGRGRRRRGDRSRGTQLGSSPAHGRDESQGQDAPAVAGRKDATHSCMGDGQTRPVQERGRAAFSRPVSETRGPPRKEEASATRRAQFAVGW